MRFSYLVFHSSVEKFSISSISPGNLFMKTVDLTNADNFTASTRFTWPLRQSRSSIAKVLTHTWWPLLTCHFHAGKLSFLSRIIAFLFFTSNRERHSTLWALVVYLVITQLTGSCGSLPVPGIIWKTISHTASSRKDPKFKIRSIVSTECSASRTTVKSRNPKSNHFKTDHLY